MDEEIVFCRLCLATDVRMYKLDTTTNCSFGVVYSHLLQIPMKTIPQNQHICYECSFLLNKYHKFKTRCYLAQNILSLIEAKSNKLTKEEFKSNKEKYQLKSLLSVSSLRRVDLEVCNTLNEEIICEEKPPLKLDSDDNIKQEFIEVEVDVHLERLDIDATYYNENLSDDDKPLVIKKSSSKVKLKTEKKKREKRSKVKKNKQIVENDNCSDIKEFFTVANLTPDEQLNEVLLRKTSNNYIRCTYKCDLCFRGYSDITTFNNHMKKHNIEQGEFECDLCHVRFSTKRCLYKHKLLHSTKYACKQCPFVCFTKEHAKTHIRVHQGIKFTCELCGEQFNLLHSLTMHKRLKHLEQSAIEYMCEFCGDKFTTRRGIDVHTSKMHSLDKNEKLGPQCAECDVHFSSEAAWKRHLVLSSKHTVSNGCKLCGESFSSAADLKSHKRVHGWRDKKIGYAWYNRPVNCGICNKLFSSRPALTAHMKAEHADSIETKSELSWVCEHCGKAFMSARPLLVHRRTHTGERAFACGECGRAFTTAKGRAVHVANRHQGERHQCHVCARVFTLHTALVKHVRTLHENIRPHKCVSCTKTFAHPCDLKTHMKHAHDKVPYPKKKKK